MKPKNLAAGMVLSAFAAGATLAPISSVYAQGAGGANANAPLPGQSSIAMTGPDMRASKMIGARVDNAKGEKLGKIEDVIIDIDNGRAQYAVLSFGGMLGLGGKQFAIPVSRLGSGKDGDRLVLNVNKEQLKDAPGFEPDKRPNFSEETYRGAVDRFFFKEETMRHTPAGARLVQADELIGKKVNDRAGHQAGKIEDLVVNFNSGRAYAVMNVDQAMTGKGKLVPLPLNALSLPSRPDIAPILNVDAKTLAFAPGFANGQWPDLRSPDYQKHISQQLASLQSQIRSTPQNTRTERETASGSSR